MALGLLFSKRPVWGGFGSRMANMWRRGGEKRHDAPDGRSLAVVIPCAGRGFRGRVCLLSLFMVRFLGLGSIKRDE